MAIDTIYDLGPDNIVRSGPYVGEYANVCGPEMGQMRLPSVVLTAEEARRLRPRHNLSDEAFYLDKTSLVAGIYCNNTKNYSVNDKFVRDFDCRDLGERFWGFFSGKYFGGRLFEARCHDIKRDMEPHLSQKHNEPSEVVEWYHSIRGGAGFGIGMLAVGYISWSPIKKLVKAIKNGKGGGGPVTLPIIAGIAVFAASEKVYASPQRKDMLHRTDEQYEAWRSQGRCFEDALSIVVDSVF